MRKTLLTIMTLLSMASMLSGCLYYPYRDDWYERGEGHHRGYYEDRGYHGSHEGYRDDRDRR